MLAQFAINKRLISAISTLLILLVGYMSYNELPRFEDPEFTIRVAQIVTPYPGATADQVSEEVTEVIENALQQLEGVKELKSASTPGLSTVSVEFTLEAASSRNELLERFAQMRAKVSDVQTQLPPDALPSQVYDDFGDVFALYFAIIGDGFSMAEIHDQAKELQRKLAPVEGVSKVSITGAPQEVIYVEFDPAQLIKIGLSPSQIAQVLNGQNVVSPAGSVLAGESRLELRPLAGVGTLDAIENLVISHPQSGSTYQLSDIAEVTRGYKEPATKLLFRDGRPAIGLAISNELGGNVVEMGEAVAERLSLLEAQLPAGIEILTISDQPELVEDSVGDFVMNVVMAIAIVVVTLLLFMGLRSGLMMGGILLVTVAGTLFGMYLFNLDMQRISLGALIIALGMLVDNAIVVVEGTLVRVQKGEDPTKATLAVVKQTQWPLLAGTLVGILAFSPIGFSPDNTGEYAGSLFWTILISLFFSWIVAIWLTPYYCVQFLKAPKAVKDKSKLLIWFEAMLSKALRLRVLVMSVVGGLFVSAVLGFAMVPPGFFPASTRAQFVLDYQLPQGTDISQTETDIKAIEEHVLTLDGVTSTNVSVGGGHVRFMLVYEAEDQNSGYAQILIDVENYEQVAPLQSELQPWLNENYPQANAKVWQFVLGPGGGSKVEAQFSGPDPVVLRDLASTAKAILTSAGAENVKDDWKEQVRTIRPVVDSENARRLGLTQSDIAKALNTQLVGENIGHFREGEEILPVVMRPHIDNRDDVAELRDVQIFSPNTGEYVPITQVVERFDMVFEPGKLRKIDRELTITAQADNAHGTSSGDLFEQVKEQIEGIELPPGYSLEWKGEYGNSKEANEGLAKTMPLGFGAMALVVIFLFNTVRQPLIIWLTVPLALIGVVWGMVALQTPLEFMAILGVLSLTGMLIKNAIVLVDEIDLQIAGGKARLTSVIEATASRVRPVVLGVLTTVLGVVPLLWDPFFNSLAVVIVCGLTFATILTLVVVPVLYALFFNVGMDEVTERSV